MDSNIVVNTQAILLDPETAKKWEMFCKYEPMLEIMEKSGVFNTKNGQVIMNFNSQGHLMNITISISAYQNRK